MIPLTYWSPAGGDALLQASVEFDWQVYNKNGRKIILFNRYYGNVWSQAPNTMGPFAWSPTIVSYGWETTQGGVGVSWKPITDANLVLTVERQFPVGRQGVYDWLYRAGYSWDKGYEFKPFVKSWPYITFYGEYDYWSSADRHSFGIETRWGAQYTVGRSVFPFGLHATLVLHCKLRLRLLHLCAALLGHGCRPGVRIQKVVSGR